MSIREFKKLIEARKIVKDELAKVKIEDQGVDPRLVQVEYAVQLNADQFNEEKRMLRANLNKIMTLSQANEIVNDNSIITDRNIYQLNRSWDSFIKGVTKEFSNLTFNTFVTILKTFLRRLEEPNDQQAQLNKQAEIIDILQRQSLTTQGLAPKIEQIINLMQTNYVPVEVLSDIQERLSTESITKNVVDQVLREINSNVFERQFENVKEMGGDEEGEDVLGDLPFFEPSIYSGKPGGASASTASSSQPPNIPAWNTQHFSEDEIKAKAKSGKWKKAFDNFVSQTGSQKDEALEFLSTSLTDTKKREIFLEQVKNLSGDTSKASKGIPSNKTIFENLSPYITDFRNFKVEELVKKGISLTEAKKQAEDDSKELFGLGLKKDNRTRKEQTVPFGVLQLNMDKLKAGHLKISYNNGNMVKEIKLTPISDKFQSMVQDILHKKKFSEAKFNKLSDDEKLMYKVMIKKARVAGDIDVRLDQLGTPTIEKLKNEWDVVMGQISAGNDNPTLRKRAKELIQSFIDKKMITKAEGVNLLMNL